MPPLRRQHPRRLAGDSRASARRAAARGLVDRASAKPQSKPSSPPRAPAVARIRARSRRRERADRVGEPGSTPMPRRSQAGRAPGMPAARQPEGWRLSQAINAPLAASFGVRLKAAANSSRSPSPRRLGLLRRAWSCATPCGTNPVDIALPQRIAYGSAPAPQPRRPRPNSYRFGARRTRATGGAANGVRFRRQRFSQSAQARSARERRNSFPGRRKFCSSMSATSPWRAAFLAIQ